MYATVNQVFPGTGPEAAAGAMKQRYEAEISRLRRVLAEATMNSTQRNNTQEDETTRYKFQILQHEHSTQAMALERVRSQHAQEKKKNQRLQDELKQVRFDLYMSQRQLEKAQQSSGCPAKAWAPSSDTESARTHTTRSSHAIPRRRRRGGQRNLEALQKPSDVDLDLSELGEEGEAVLAMLKAQEDELARIRAESSAVALAMKKIEDGSYDDYYSDSEEEVNSRSRRSIQTARESRNPADKLPTTLGKSETRALQPAPPESRSKSGNSKAPRKNWKSDYGNWIYILGNTGSSLRAKDVAKHHTIDKYSSLESVRSTTNGAKR